MVLSVLLVTLSVLAIGLAINLPCRFPCRGPACDEEPKDCQFGTKKLCGWNVCAKGPGEKCGGYLYVHGLCAPGLSCDNCGICTGCYRRSIFEVDLKCHHSDSSKCFSNGL